jgi:hypothetical protein
VKKIFHCDRKRFPFASEQDRRLPRRRSSHLIRLRLRSPHLLLLQKEERETGQEDGTDLVRFRLWQCLPAGCCQGRRISATEVSLATARIREHRFGLQGSVRPLSHPFQDLLRSLGQAVVLTFTLPRFSFLVTDCQRRKRSRQGVLYESSHSHQGWQGYWKQTKELPKHSLQVYPSLQRRDGRKI